MTQTLFSGEPPHTGKAPRMLNAAWKTRPRATTMRSAAVLEGKVATSPEPNVLGVALAVYRYARRWAVGQSSDPADAVIYDACVTVINDHYAPHRLDLTGAPSATSDRYLRYGAETIQNAFTIPITVSDAVVILHRYARRYTNGRGSYTAALVNSSAQNLLALKISLDETERVDGTIWASDGTDGSHDQLTPEQRAEALSVLPHTPNPDDMSEE